MSRVPGTVAVVGLGNMGSGIAATLTQHGVHTLGVDPQVSDGGLSGIEPASLEDAVARAETLVLSLPGSAVVEEVLSAAGLTRQGAAPRLVIDTSTADPQATRSLAEQLQHAGHAMVDAPVSGGPAGAASGQLTVFLGGQDHAVEKAAPILEIIAGRFTHVGGPGAGAVAKLVNNMLVAVHLHAAGEALSLIEAAGLAPHRVLDAINAGSGRSAVTEDNLPRWVLSGTFDSGFSAGLMSRDISLVLQAASGLELEMPLAERSAQAWKQLSDHDPSADFNRMASSDKTV